jgi:hypothetical protein
LPPWIWSPFAAHKRRVAAHDGGQAAALQLMYAVGARFRKNAGYQGLA